MNCMACHEKATIKDYREHNQIIDGYPVCVKHFGFDDLNFWKAVKRKGGYYNGKKKITIRDAYTV